MDVLEAAARAGGGEGDEGCPGLPSSPCISSFLPSPTAWQVPQRSSLRLHCHLQEALPDCSCPPVPRSSAASTLSQLSDSGQTLSEDSGVDAGEVEASASGQSRQMASTKSRSSKELPRSERTTEGGHKPVRRAGREEVQGWEEGRAQVKTGGAGTRVQGGGEFPMARGISTY